LYGLPDLAQLGVTANWGLYRDTTADVLEAEIPANLAAKQHVALHVFQRDIAARIAGHLQCPTCIAQAQVAPDGLERDVPKQLAEVTVAANVAGQVDAALHIAQPQVAT